MRGVYIFMLALFLLSIYYAIMAMVFQPLIDVITAFDLSAVDGQSSINTLQNIMFLWGPAVYITGWFVWAARYYISRNLFVSGPRGRRP